MHFGFTLELSDIDLWNIDLLDAHLDLLDTDIPSKYFVSLHSVFKTSSRYVFKTSSRYVFKTSSRHVFKTSSRRLQRNNFSSSKTSSRKGRSKIVTLKTCWRRLQDQQMFAGHILQCRTQNTRLLNHYLVWSYKDLRDLHWSHSHAHLKHWLF